MSIADFLYAADTQQTASHPLVGVGHKNAFGKAAAAAAQRQRGLHKIGDEQDQDQLDDNQEVHTDNEGAPGMSLRVFVRVRACPS